jgi:hypothetical protein
LSFGESNEDDDSSSDEDSSPAVESEDERSEESSRSVASAESEAVDDGNGSGDENAMAETEGPNQFEASDSKNQYQASIKAKRVLSSNTLAQLNIEAGHPSESPKKMRSSPDERKDSPPPEFSLGPCAMNSLGPLPNQSAMRGSPDYSTDGEDLDARLSEELERQARGSPDHSPVPLLTPPQSPLTVDLDGDVTSMCEWPSNLVVDSVMMTAATETRPLSPASLEDADLAEEERLADAKEPSSLTPLLKSIYVGTD